MNARGAKSQPPARGAWLTYDHIWQTLRMLAACGLAWMGTAAFDLKEVYWALITATVVTQPQLPATLKAGRDRILGALLGAAIGFLVIEAVQHGWPRLPLFWAALVPLAIITAKWPNLRFACATLIVLVLVPSTDTADRPIDRVIEIVIGTVASVVATAAMWWARPASADAND
jgi:uncharacterized membrane protein YccC